MEITHAPQPGWRGETRPAKGTGDTQCRMNVRRQEIARGYVARSVIQVVGVGALLRAPEFLCFRPRKIGDTGTGATTPCANPDRPAHRALDKFADEASIT